MNAGFEIQGQGDGEYLVQLHEAGQDNESWVRVTPDARAALGIPDGGEGGVVHRTVEFLLRHQDAADFPRMVELEDVLSSYPDYAQALRDEGASG